MGYTGQQKPEHDLIYKVDNIKGVIASNEDTTKNVYFCNSKSIDNFHIKS